MWLVPNWERELKTVQCHTYWARIYIAGPIEIAKQILREECLREGLCVTIESTNFVYTGGEEIGYVVELINYPRFPLAANIIWDRAWHILNLLLEKTFQHSALLMTPGVTKWVTKRETN